MWACRVLLRWCVRLVVAYAVGVVLAAALLVVAVDTDTDLMGFGATDTSLSAVRVMVQTGTTISGVRPHRLELTYGNEWVYVPGLEADFKKSGGARMRFKLEPHAKSRHPFIDPSQIEVLGERGLMVVVVGEAGERRVRPATKDDEKVDSHYALRADAVAFLANDAPRRLAQYVSSVRTLDASGAVWLHEDLLPAMCGSGQRIPDRACRADVRRWVAEYAEAGVPDADGESSACEGDWCTLYTGLEDDEDVARDRARVRECRGSSGMLVTPRDFKGLTATQIKTFFTSMLHWLGQRDDTPYAMPECVAEQSVAGGDDSGDGDGAPRRYDVRDVASGQWSCPASTDASRHEHTVQRDFGSAVPRSSTWPMLMAEMALKKIVAREGAGQKYKRDTQRMFFVLGATGAHSENTADIDRFYRGVLRVCTTDAARSVEVSKDVESELANKLFRPFMSKIWAEEGGSDTQYSRYRTLFVELAGNLSPAAQEIVQLFTGTHGNRLNPFECLEKAQERRDAIIPGLKEAIHKSDICAGTTHFGGGPAGVVDMLYALGDTTYGFFRMLRAGILDPERIWTAVHIRTTRPEVVTTLSSSADFRNSQPTGREAAAKMLAAYELTDPADATHVLSAPDIEKEIGYMRWACGSGSRFCDISLMLGPCPYRWYGCPARAADGESTWDTTWKWAGKAATGREAKLVEQIVQASAASTHSPAELDAELTGGSDVFQSFHIYDMGFFVYIDKAAELLSAGIDAISGTTRGFLGSMNLSWLALSPRYLRQVISWSGDDSRELSQCHLGLPPYSAAGSFFERADEAANRPIIHAHDGQTVALSRGITMVFDSVYGEGLTAGFKANTKFHVPQTVQTNDDDPETGRHRPGASREQLSAPQMVEFWEQPGPEGLTGRQSGAEAETCDFTPKWKGALKRASKLSAALQDGELAERLVLLQRVDEPSPLPASHKPRALMGDEWWEEMTSLSASWMRGSTGHCEGSEDRHLLVDTAGTGSTARQIAAALGVPLADLPQHLRHVDAAQWAAGGCEATSDSLLRLKPGALLLLSSGSTMAMTLPTAAVPGASGAGLYSVSARNDLNYLREQTCETAANAADCKQLFADSLLHTVPETVARTLQPEYVLRHAEPVVKRAVDLLPQKLGPEISGLRCALSAKAPGCKVEADGVLEMLRQCSTSTVETAGACSVTLASEAAAALDTALFAVRNLDDLHGSSLQEKLLTGIERFQWLRSWVPEASPSLEPVFKHATDAVATAAEKLKTDLSPSEMRALADKLSSSSTSAATALGFSKAQIAECGSSGRRKVTGLDYAIYLSWDPRELVFVGELHSMLRCTTSVMMDLIGRILDRATGTTSTAFWKMVGVISNIASSRKTNPGGKKADYATASQAYGRKIWKFFVGDDAAMSRNKVSPCAASSLPAGQLRKAQEVRCTQMEFFYLVYRSPMSVHLFGIGFRELGQLLLDTTDSWISSNWKLFPSVLPPGFSRKYDWAKRSCLYYATELPLRFLAHGRSDPWESQCEEAQGFGRQAMRGVRHLMSAKDATHNPRVLEQFGTAKSSAPLSDAQMKADWLAHEKKERKRWEPIYAANLRRLRELDTEGLLDGYETPWRDITDSDVGDIDGAEAAQDTERASDTFEERVARGEETG